MAMEVQARTSMWYWSFQQGVCPFFSTIDNQEVIYPFFWHSTF
jgi:hypothetical protein